MKAHFKLFIYTHTHTRKKEICFLCHFWTSIRAYLSSLKLHFLYHFYYFQIQKLSLPISQTLYSVQFSHSVVSNSLRPHELQHARPPCPSPTPRVYSNTCPLSGWCHPTISSCVVPFSSCLQSFSSSGSFQMSQLFTSGGQSIGVSAITSVLPMNTQD